MGMFSRSSSSSVSTTTIDERTSTTTVPQEIDGEENVTIAGVEGAVNIVEPGSTAASINLVQKALETVDRTSGSALAFGRESLNVVLKEALNFAGRETARTQEAAIKTQEQIAGATRQESTKTLEKLTTIVVVGLTIVLVVFFWKS